MSAGSALNPVSSVALAHAIDPGQGRFARRLATQSSHQLNTVFGSGYVPEQHRDETHRNLPPSANPKLISELADLLMALRAKLSLRWNKRRVP